MGCGEASADKAARVWDVAPAQARYPDWLLQLSEAISGQVLNKQDVLEQTRLNRIEMLDQIPQKLNQEPGDDDWAVWGRWFLGDRAKRTISPFSKITVPEYIENQIKEKTPRAPAAKKTKAELLKEAKNRIRRANS